MNGALDGPGGAGHRRLARHRPGDRAPPGRAPGRACYVNFVRDEAAAEETVRLHPRRRRQCRAGALRRRRRRRRRPRRSRRVASAAGACDILVNNAGMTIDNLLLRLKPEEWDRGHGRQPARHLQLHAGGAARTMVRAHYGRIVNLSSVVGLDGQRRAGGLRRGQGRRHRLHQVDGARAGVTRHHRQRRRARA